MSPSSNLQT